MSLVDRLLHDGWLRPVDHALAATLRRRRSDTPEAVLLAAALASRALAQGHGALPLRQVEALFAEVKAEPAPSSLPSLDAWLQALRVSSWVFQPDSEHVDDDSGDDSASTGFPLVLHDDAVYLRRYWRYQQRLASAVLARRVVSRALLPETATAACESRLRQLFPALADDPDDAQAAAARLLPGTRLLLLTGGPGTGKTTTVARAVVHFAERFAAATAATTASVATGVDPAAASRPARVLLAAPTGKAAARLAEAVRENLGQLLRDGVISAACMQSLPTTASTLHRLLGWRPGGQGFRHDGGHPLPADLVVVDEASMIDLPMMAKLLDAMATEATLVLIGDRDQLPSVETGDVLAALCDAAPLRSNSEAGSIARIHLSRMHRQGDDVDVAALAALVRDGEAEAALAGLAAQGFRGVHWRQGADRDLAAAVLAAALPAYRAVQAAPDVAAALLLARRFRVLAAVREGAAGSQTLNAVIAAALDPARRGDGLFRGKLLLVTENSYRHGLFNGDIGIVWPDEHGEHRVWFETNQGSDGSAANGSPRAWLPAALPAHEPAFALTVHKAQGSEFERILLALPEHGSRGLSRELLYTGLTRCRSEVMLWASEACLSETIHRRAQRWSGLTASLLKTAAAKKSAAPGAPIVTDESGI